MQFDELAMYAAVYRVREKMKELAEEPGAESWVNDNALELTRRLSVEMILEPNPALLAVWVKYRKSASSDDARKKYDIICELFMAGDKSCFYSNRGVGPCDDVVTLDRIIPGCRGGEYLRKNCVLCCLKHNSERNDRPIEEWLK